MEMERKISKDIQRAKRQDHWLTSTHLIWKRKKIKSSFIFKNSKLVPFLLFFYYLSFSYFVVATTNQNNQWCTKVILSHKNLIGITRELDKKSLIYSYTIYTTNI